MPPHRPRAGSAPSPRVSPLVGPRLSAYPADMHLSTLHRCLCALSSGRGDHPGRIRHVLLAARTVVPALWAGAQRTGIAAGARVWTCVYRVLSCGHRTMNRCVFSFKCGVLQCVPLNLDDINVFWNRLRCARGRADARTNEFTVSDDVTRMALWRSRIALETRYPRLCRLNKVVSARYTSTQYTAGTTRHGPL